MAKGDFRLRKSLWDRFHDKVFPDPISGCWIWGGATKEKGYGVIGIGHRHWGTEKAHRTAYRLYKGEIPKGMNVLHSCDVPCCVNPNHLRIGSLKDNSQDCLKKGRMVFPDNRGERATWAKLTEEQAREIIENRNGPRGVGAELARKFNVSRSAIYEIWRGKNWASLNS